MGMGCTRAVERVLAAVGKLDEAPSRFEASVDVWGAGVLWVLPALLANGLLQRVNSHFSLPKCFYGLCHIFVLLAFMALARIRCFERLRYHAPGELGTLLGLDRIPEVRTLRQKVKTLTEQGEVQRWSARLCEQWMQAEPQAAGILYVDGHVRVYHGSQTKLPRRYVSRQRLCLRGTSDYWVKDGFFVVSSPFTEGLLQMLRSEIVPRLLREVPAQPSAPQLQQQRYRSRFTIVFDREGYSPEFFHQMWQEHRIACITYRKYSGVDWPKEEFEHQEVAMPHGERVTMKLAERGVYLGERDKGLWLREIRKLSDSGHQTALISTDFSHSRTYVGGHMFARWSQENFLKYMMEHFNIDALIDYDTEPADETEKVINPAYRKLAAAIKSKAAKHSRRVRQFGQLLLHDDCEAEDTAAYERRKGELREAIEHLDADLHKLKQQRTQTTKHLPLGQLPEEERFHQLAPIRKQFIDTIRMIAYRAETAMAAVLRETLAHPDEARPLLRDIFTTPADLIPDENNQTLTVRLHSLSNANFNRAARRLADQLNQTETEYPGTSLRLQYELVSD